MSARVAEERRRIFGHGSTEEEEKSHKGSVIHAKGCELSAWKQFQISPPIKKGAQSKAIADTRWVLTRKVVDGKKTAKARLVGKV